MKSFYTAKELAGLDGMPGTERGVRKMADRDNWPYQSRAGKGGGREYAISSLPEATKDHLHRLVMAAGMKGDTIRNQTADSGHVPLHSADSGHVPLHSLTTGTTPPAPSLTTGGGAKELVKVQALTELKTWQREVFEARLMLYKEFLRLRVAHRTEKAIEKLVGLARIGDLPEYLQRAVILANARRGDERTLSRSMILGWDRAVKAGGEMALAPQPVREQPIPEWAGLFIKCYGMPQKPSLTEAMEALAKILPEGMEMPSYHQVYRFHTQRSRLDRERGRRTGSELKAVRGYRQRDTSDMLPMQVGTCDGYSFKSPVAHPITGNPFNPEICSVADVASRMVLGWSVGLAESAQTVISAVRHAATVSAEKPCGGIFDILYTDNGSGNLANLNTDEVTGIFARIGTTHKTGIPGNPQGRGLIERLNASLWLRAAKKLPTFAGKLMDKSTKREIFLTTNREIKKNGTTTILLTWPQFKTFLDQEVEAYNNRPHSALPKITDPETGLRRYLTPVEAWRLFVANGWKQEEHHLPEQTLEYLFLPRIMRTVRRAKVEFNTNTYYHKSLEHIEGEKVQVGYDIHDAETVQIWTMDGRLFCVAVFDKNKHRYFPLTDQEQAANQRAQRRSQLLQDELVEIENERRGVIEIAPVAERIDFAAQSFRIKADREKLQAEMTAPKAFVTPKEDKEKYLLWKSLDARFGNGEMLAEEEVRFYEYFQKRPAFRAFKEVEENLGKRAEA